MSLDVWSRPLTVVGAIGSGTSLAGVGAALTHSPGKWGLKLSNLSAAGLEGKSKHGEVTLPRLRRSGDLDVASRGCVSGV